MWKAKHRPKSQAQSDSLDLRMGLSLNLAIWKSNTKIQLLFLTFICRRWPGEGELWMLSAELVLLLVWTEHVQIFIKRVICDYQKYFK